MKKIGVCFLIGILGLPLCAQRPRTWGGVGRPTTQVTVIRPETDVQNPRPFTQVQVQKPTTAVEVIRPTTQVEVVRPQTNVAVVRPSTQVEVLRPQTTVEVIHPTTTVEVIHPQTEMIEEQESAYKGFTAGRKQAPSEKAAVSAQTPTSMSDYTPKTAKDFTAPEKAAKLGGAPQLAGTGDNQAEKDAVNAASLLGSQQNVDLDVSPSKRDTKDLGKLLESRMKSKK